MAYPLHIYIKLLKHKFSCLAQKKSYFSKFYLDFWIVVFIITVAQPLNFTNRKEIIMEYKDWTLEAIIAWCKENNQVAWLKATKDKIVERKVYPKIASTSKNGKKSWVADKSATPTIEKSRISFVELKSEFISTFIETTPKPKKLSMYDIIDAL